ncbi:hypothetical protein QJU87_04305 [Pasteurella skyensis]|nr:hypothetical protein [Pasteurella skyensis]
MFTFNQKSQLDNLLIPQTLRRIGNDLRKTGAIAGIGFVGLVLPNDDIELTEAFALIVLGILSWGIGLYLEYLSDRIETALSNTSQKRNKKSKRR